MKSPGDNVFYEEMARFMPVFLRAVAIRQEKILMGGDIAISHIVVIDVLSEKGTCTMGEIAKALNLTMSAATSIVDKMIEKGLVSRERDKSDRRVVRVSLVSGGKALAKKIYIFRKNVSKDLYSSLTIEEKNVHMVIMKKIYDNVIRKRNDKC